MHSKVWTPKHPKQSRMWQFLQQVNDRHHKSFQNYQDLYDWSISDPAQFWQALAEYVDLEFTTEASEILHQPQPMIDARWFVGAKLNYAERLLQRSDDHPALISVNETGQRQVLSYKELNQQVAACAKGLELAGVTVGTRVAAVMPNVSQTIIAMLATASLGAIWSSCSPDFGAQAAIDRLGQIAPKVLFICDGHQYMGKKHDGRSKIEALAAAIPSLTTIVICPIIHPTPVIPVKAGIQILTWNQFLQTAKKCHFVQLPFEHPLYILFSSGTTGKPKCIMHGAGGTILQHLKELALHCDLQEQDNLCFYTTCGWMMWNWMVSTLALGATLTLYEGAPTYPDANRLFQLIEEEKITVFGTSAKFISTVEKEGVYPKQKQPMKSLRAILSTGSPLLPNNYDFVYQHIKEDVQLSSISGGTDIVSCFALGNPLLPVYRGELQCLGLGMAVQVFNEQGQAVCEERGELVCTQAFPSMPIGFWNDPERQAYKHAYFDRFPGVWAHGDFAELTKHQGLIIYGRSDAVLNPGGVRIGTAEIYRQVETIEEIVDSVVIGQAWEGDVRIVLFVKLREEAVLDEPLENKICQTIRRNASPRHVPAKIVVVKDIPRTISGKIVELAVKQTVEGQPVHNLGSLANPEALQDYQNREELK